MANVNYKKGDKVRVKSIRSRQDWTLPENMIWLAQKDRLSDL